MKSDGTAWAWGNNALGQLGLGTTTNHAAPVQVPGLAGVTQVAAGQTHSLAIAGPGSSVWAWGDDSSSQLGDGATKEQNSPESIGLTGITQVSAGFNQSAAVSSNAAAYSWGKSGYIIDWDRPADHNEHILCTLLAQEGEPMPETQPLERHAPLPDFFADAMWTTVDVPIEQYFIH